MEDIGHQMGKVIVVVIPIIHGVELLVIFLVILLDMSAVYTTFGIGEMTRKILIILFGVTNYNELNYETANILFQHIIDFAYNKL